jgi:L-asparaginase
MILPLLQGIFLSRKKNFISASPLEASKKRVISLEGEMMKITMISTGGTIEKTYNELDGSLSNYSSVMVRIINSLRLPDLQIMQQSIIFKDSLDMDENDRDIILRIVLQAMKSSEAVIILHGTDTLEITGEKLHNEIELPACPIILTGAMQPFVFKDTDAMQNVTESLLAARLLSPGIYAVMHNRVLAFPGVIKDRKAGTFIKL